MGVSFQVKEYIDQVYSNVFLIATRAGVDLETAIRQAEEELNELYDKEENDHIFEHSKGLVFIELLARRVRSSLIEMLYLRESDRDYILQELLDRVYASDSVIEGMGNNIDSKEAKFSIPYSDYALSFEKIKLSNTTQYRFILNRTNSQYSSEFFPQEVCIESSGGGCLGEFIEKVLVKQHEKITENNDVTPQLMNNSFGISISNQDNSTEDELVASLYEDTSTTELFDEFEGYGQIESTVYQRIVIKNSKYRGLVPHKSTPGFNFVIERGNKLDRTGAMTLNELMQGKDKIFAKYVSLEITDDIVTKYLDTDRFYRFSKPILLITQYGVRNGGKANEYYIVGTYISSGFIYDIKTRKAFISTENSVIDDKDNTSISNAANLNSHEDVVYTVRPYTGVVKSITNNMTVSEYVLVKKDKSSKGYIPVAVDDIDKTIYIYEPLYEEYKDSLNVDTLQLWGINGTDTREVAVSLVLQKEDSKNTHISEKPLDHVGTYERSNDIGIGNDGHNGKNESDVIVKKEKPTVIKVLKSGNQCPDCGKMNSITNAISVIDEKGNSRIILGTKCSCGTVYLTKKQYKKLHNKTYLKIYEDNALSSIKPAKKKPVSKYNSYTPVYSSNTPVYSSNRPVNSSNKPVYNSYPSVWNDIKMKPNTRECKKCGRIPIAAGALSKGLQLCWECYKEEISSMFEY